MKSLKEAGWIKACLWMPFYSHRSRWPTFNLFSVYKLQLEQLRDFVPLDWLFSFLSHPSPRPHFSDGKSERRVHWWQTDEPHVSWGGWENQWPSAPRQLRCWRLQRSEMGCCLWMGKRPLEDGLVTQGSCRPGVRISANALSAWRRRSPTSWGTV